MKHARIALYVGLLLVFLVQSTTCDGKSPEQPPGEPLKRTPDRTLPSSTPGVQWTAIVPGTQKGTTTFGNNHISAVAWGNNTFVAGGYNGKMAYSADGIHWTALKEKSFDLGNIAWGRNRFVASYLDADLKTKIAYSTNGRNWTVARIPYEFFIVSDIAWGGGIFIAAGDAVGDANDWTLDGRMIYSVDGKNWTAVADTSFGDNPIHAVAWGGGTFVAGGFMGKMAYSTDGKNWTAVAASPFGNSPVYDIAWGGGTFVATGDRGKMAYSTDSIHWTSVSASPFGTGPIHTISWGGGAFIAAGRNNRMARSADGIHWTLVPETGFGSSTIYAIAWGNGTFVAVGDDGKVGYSR
jgi:hypothetical protein